MEAGGHQKALQETVKYHRIREYVREISKPI
jgi:hypothetical protein